MITISDSYYLYPKPQGPFTVGYVKKTLLDDQRLDPYHPEDVRQLLLTIFYPSYDEPVLEPLDQATLALWKEREMGQRVTSYHHDELAQLDQIRRYSSAGALIAQGLFPLIIFSLGYTMTSGNYFSLVQELVSQGYMVITVDHPYVAHQVNFPDGKVCRHQAPFDDKIYQTCVQDLSAVLDELQKQRTQKPFDQIDFDKIGIMGHSLGGMAIIGVLGTLNICKAGIALDSALDIKAVPGQVNKDFAGTTYDGLSTIPKPFLHLQASDHYEVFGYPQTTIPQLGKDNYLIVVPETSHNSFTDNVIMKELVPVFKKRGLYLRTGHAHGYEIHKKVSNQVLTFFDYFLTLTKRVGYSKSF